MSPKAYLQSFALFHVAPYFGEIMSTVVELLQIVSAQLLGHSAKWFVPSSLDDPQASRLNLDDP